MLAKDYPIPFNRYKVRAASLPVNLSGANTNTDYGSQSREVTRDQLVSLVLVSLVQAIIRRGQ